jgi:hypothetical protein
VFRVFCPRCVAWVLLDVSRVRRVTNLETGVMVVELECYDGETILTVTGLSTGSPT